MKKSLLVAVLAASMVMLAACGKTEENVAEAPETEAVATVEDTEADVAEVEVETEVEAEAEAEEKGEGVMSFDDYMAAAVDTEVTVETYVQAANSWWDGKITVYSADQDGAYFLYDMACSEEDAAKLVPGTKIKVNGFKSEWSGEIEIIDGTFEFEDGDTYVAPVQDVTEFFGQPELADYMNQKFSVTGAVVEASTDADGNEADWLYNWDGSGEEGNDVYFNVNINGESYAFLVRAYLTGPDTDVYKAAKELKVGDTIDCEGFLYWYNGANPHITSITVK